MPARAWLVRETGNPLTLNHHYCAVEQATLTKVALGRQRKK